MTQTLNMKIRAMLRTKTSRQLLQDYDRLVWGQVMGVELVDANQAITTKIIREVLWERGKEIQEGYVSHSERARISE